MVAKSPRITLQVGESRCQARCLDMVRAHAQGQAEIATHQLALVVCQIRCSQHSKSRGFTPSKPLLKKLN